MLRERIEEVAARLTVLKPDAYDTPAERHEKNGELSAIMIELLEEWSNAALKEGVDGR